MTESQGLHDHIEQLLRDAIAEIDPFEVVTPDSSLIDDVGLDDLEIHDLLAEIEYALTGSGRTMLAG